MFSQPRLCRYFALLLCVAVAGCAPLNKYSFETFSPDPAHTVPGMGRSDRLALIYADYVARLLEGRSTGARVIRETSDSSLAVGGALLAAKETLEISAESVAHMGVGIVIVQQLQKIFNAGGRSEAFADAAYLIRQAQNEYRQYNPTPSETSMTENGAILVSRVDAAVYAAQKTLTGRLPALLDLKQATQPMTKAGADRQSSGTPRTLSNAAGDSPEQVQAAARRARVDEAVERPQRVPQVVSRRQIETLIQEQADHSDAQKESERLGAVSPEQFLEDLKAADKTIPATTKEAVYQTIFANAKIDLKDAAFAKLGPNVGFNMATLNEAYARFPGKQLRLMKEISKLKPNPNEPALPDQ